MVKVSRKDALALGLSRYFTGRPCVNGHVSERYASCGCVQCQSENANYRRKRTRIEYNAKRRERYRTDGGARREQGRLDALRYRKENPAKSRAAGKRQRERSFVTVKGRAHEILNACKDRARKKGIEFGLTLPWVVSRIAKGCELTQLSFELQPANHGRKSRSPSIDRRDCTKGYTEDNCRVILWGLNAALHNWGEAEYRSIAEAYFKCFP